tara:strand:+ start:86974 stop:87138 length:165 start_codon:yes stop_codon:yes gene_type:complete
VHQADWSKSKSLYKIIENQVAQSLCRLFYGQSARWLRMVAGKRGDARKDTAFGG